MESSEVNNVPFNGKPNAIKESNDINNKVVQKGKVSIPPLSLKP